MIISIRSQIDGYINIFQIGVEVILKYSSGYPGA
jgi:hypothetical protein